MGGCQNTGILHVTFQIPELLQTNTAHIDNIGRCDDRGLGVGS